jgi:hypothetical protein
MAMKLNALNTRTLPPAVTSHLTIATLVFGSDPATRIVSFTSKGRLVW